MTRFLRNFGALSFLFAATVVGPLAVSAAPISVTPSEDETTLTDALFGGPTGSTVGNRSLTGVAGTSPQQGTFVSGAVIGIPSGLFLTTGQAAFAAAPNSTLNGGSTLGTGGDADLSALVSGGTFDANALTFIFTPTDSGNLVFRYVFASEEFNYSLAVNDVFGLYVDGTNRAQAQVGTASFNPNLTVGSGDIEYDGYTNVFSTTIAVTANQPYVIKLAIADEVDGAVDSAVFLSARFQLPNQVPEPDSLVLIGLAVLALVAVRRRLLSAPLI